MTQHPINPTATPSSDDIVTIGLGWEENWERNFNPFSINGIYLPGNCIYEPMMMFNARTGELVPWLASGYRWGLNSQTIIFTLRKGVQWSDGKPFTSEDVVGSFQMRMKHEEITGALADFLRTNIDDISAIDSSTVEFHFKNVNTLGLYRLASAMIVPEHIWSQLEKPTEYLDEDPVGTGPFTEVTIFENKGAEIERVLQLERNPYYWQKDQLSIQGVKFSFRHPEYTLNDLIQGKLDWAAIDIPDIEKEFLSLNPTYYQVLIDPAYSTNLLQLNTIRPPFDNPDVRKAISMSIDRQQIVDAISQGYWNPANAVGLSERFKSWWNDEAIQAGTWIENNPSQANAILDSLGFKRGPDGTRITPEGKPMVYKLIIDPGYPEQETVGQILSLNLANIGIVVSVSPDEKWWEHLATDQYDLALFNDFYGFSKTPYDFYAGLMSPTGVPFYGAEANQIAGRYSNPEAGNLLDGLILESHPLRQKAILDKIQAIFVEDAPSIPLYPSFYFIEFNTLRFTGFPSTENPYAEGIPGDILVLLNLMPR